MEDYTWEKEADVLGKGDAAGANELVEEYFKRLEYLASRKQVIEERTAAPLTDEELEAAQNMVLLYQLAVAMNEHERWAKTSGGQKCESGQWETRMHEGTISLSEER